MNLVAINFVHMHIQWSLIVYMALHAQDSTTLRLYEKLDTLQQFLGYDIQVLHFYCHWDDTDRYVLSLLLLSIVYSPLSPLPLFPPLSPSPFPPPFLPLSPSQSSVFGDSQELLLHRVLISADIVLTCPSLITRIIANMSATYM